MFDGGMEGRKELPFSDGAKYSSGRRKVEKEARQEERQE